MTHNLCTLVVIIIVVFFVIVWDILHIHFTPSHSSRLLVSGVDQLSVCHWSACCLLVSNVR